MNWTVRVHPVKLYLHIILYRAQVRHDYVNVYMNVILLLFYRIFQGKAHNIEYVGIHTTVHSNNSCKKKNKLFEGIKWNI